MSDPRSAVRSLFAASSAPRLPANAKGGGKASKKAAVQAPSAPPLKASTELDETVSKAESPQRSRFRDRAAERRAGLAPASFFSEAGEEPESSAAISVVEDAALGDRGLSKMAIAIMDLFQQPTPDGRPEAGFAAQRMTYAYDLNLRSSGFSWMPQTVFQSRLESDLLRANDASDKGSRLVDLEAQRRSARIGREALSKVGTRRGPSGAPPLLAKKAAASPAAPSRSSDLLTRPKLFDDLTDDEADATKKPTEPVLPPKTKEAEQAEAEGGLFGYSHLLPRLHRFDVDTPDLPRGAITYDITDAAATEEDPLASFSPTMSRLQPVGQHAGDEELFPGVLEPAHAELPSDLEDEESRPVSRKRKAAKQDRRLDSQAKKIEQMLSHSGSKR